MFCECLSVLVFVSLPPCGVNEFPPNACRGKRRAVWGRAVPIKLVRQFLSVLVWCSISKRAVRALRVVFHAPGFQDDSGLKKRAEEFPVQALVTQLVVGSYL